MVELTRILVNGREVTAETVLPVNTRFSLDLYCYLSNAYKIEVPYGLYQVNLYRPMTVEELFQCSFERK